MRLDPLHARKVEDVVCGRREAVLDGTASVRDAAQLMSLYGRGALLVRHECSYGIFTERDLLRRVLCMERDPDQTQLHEVMSTPLISISGDMPVQKALLTMRELGIRHLPVFDGSQLVAIVSMRDLATVATSEYRALAADLEQYLYAYR